MQTQAEHLQRSILREIMKRFFQLFVADTRGITAIEYGLIAGVLALGIVASVGSVADQIKATFTSISTALKH
jgi:pilus assembly protein Flp/PilA